jgi:hypothetical protein
MVLFGVIGHTKQRETHWFKCTCGIFSLVEGGLGFVGVEI